MAVKKNNILVRLIVDSREKDLSWLDKFSFDKKYSTEKIKIDGYEIASPFKCLDKSGKRIKTSTGDVGIVYSVDDGESWDSCNLSIELKRGSDFSSTIYSSYKRFMAEIDRAKENELEFYIVYDQSTKEMKECFDKLKAMNRISKFGSPHKVVYDRMLEICDMNVPMLQTHEIHEVVKRIVKYYIKKNKLQYKSS